MKEALAKTLLEKTRCDYDLIAEEFSQTRHNLWPEIAALFKDYTRDGDKILDVGCGNGRLLDLISEKKIEYVGTDNSRRQIEEARKRYPGNKFLTADALGLPFPEDSFDKVFSIAVLHHIPGRELRLRVLGEFRKTLRPGGLLFLTVWRPVLLESCQLILRHSFLKLIGKSKMDFGDVLVPWGNQTERYYHLFGKNEIEKLVGDSGFKVIRSGIAKNETGRRRNLYLVCQKP